MQIVAHIAAAAIPNSVLQYLRNGQITLFAKPTGGHKQLPMKSFFRRLALKSVMAAKKESVAKCAGPFQYGVGKPDGANTMIKTIKYLAETDNSRVLVVLGLKAAFQNVSRGAMLHSIAQTDTNLAAVFSRWYTGFNGTSNALRLKSLPTVGWIRVVLYQLVVSLQLLTQHFIQSLLSFAFSTTQAPNSSPTSMIGTCGSSRNASYRQLLLSQPLPDQSVLLHRPPKIKTGKALARIPFHPSSKTKFCSHSVVWEDICKSMEILNPALLFLGEQTTMEKTTQRFQKIATTLAHLNAEGFNVQTVNDLLTMYVGAASQHVLRMSFVPEQEAQNFDRQVFTFWSRLMHRDITSQLFFLPSSLVVLEYAQQFNDMRLRHGVRGRQSVIPSLMTTTKSPDTDSLFRSTPLLRAQLTQLQSTISQQMNKPTFLLKPLGAALRFQTTQKKQVSTIQRKIHKQFFNSLTDTPMNKPSFFHNRLHTLVHTSCSQQVRHMRLKIVAFAFQLPED